MCPEEEALSRRFPMEMSCRPGKLVSSPWWRDTPRGVLQPQPQDSVRKVPMDSGIPGSAVVPGSAPGLPGQGLWTLQAFPARLKLPSWPLSVESGLTAPLTPPAPSSVGSNPQTPPPSPPGTRGRSGGSAWLKLNMPAGHPLD